MIRKRKDLPAVWRKPPAQHGVTPRQPTPHIRRYINFLAERRIPVFDLYPCREAGAPWAVESLNNRSPNVSSALPAKADMLVDCLRDR